MIPSRPPNCPRDKSRLVPLAVVRTPVLHYGCRECGIIYRLNDNCLSVCEVPEQHLAAGERQWLASSLSRSRLPS